MQRRWICYALLCSACSQKTYDETPEGVVREFLERMERVQGESKDARATFNLLSGASQTNLSDRARRASAAMGTKIGPEHMLTPSHFYPRFQPRQWSTRKAGNRAVVEVTGVDPTNERAAIPCVLEESGWRIELELPPLPPFERRKSNERDE